jgi:endonuclease-3
MYIDKIIEILINSYPDAKAELNYTSPYELLVATILSAQCTDIRVNIITKELFKRANSPRMMIDLGLENIKDIIKSCGMYNQKAKNIYISSKILIDKFNCEVPKDRDTLMTLPGVGRKTANVVISNAFSIQAIAVDTHVFRVSKRLGLSNGKNEFEVEQGLEKNIDNNLWTHMHHALILHGRRVCMARNPKCNECNVKDLCKYYLLNGGKVHG